MSYTASRINSRTTITARSSAEVQRLAEIISDDYFTTDEDPTASIDWSITDEDGRQLMILTCEMTDAHRAARAIA